MLIIHSPRCLDYEAPGHPESPQRVRLAVECLRRGDHKWIEPTPCADEDILRVHTPALLRAVKTGDYMDSDTPYFPDIYDLARLSAGAAIQAADKALAGQSAFSLMRPPGHHAERDRIMGFCYFNNLAIAVARLLATGHARKVAILDFDCHHGNGTEDIFTGDDRVLFVSLHQSPCYPGTGLVSRDNTVNHPLPPGAKPETFLKSLDAALARLGEFAPDLLAISAGFDSYRGDPITHMGLEIDTFREIGARIRQLCRAPRKANQSSPLPAFAILEGGYSPDFGRCVEAFVRGWDQD